MSPSTDARDYRAFAGLFALLCAWACYQRFVIGDESPGTVGFMWVTGAGAVTGLALLARRPVVRHLLKGCAVALVLVSLWAGR